MGIQPDGDALGRGKRLTMAGRTHEAALLLHREANACASRGEMSAASDALEWLSWISWIELDGSRARWCARKMLQLKVPEGSAAAFRAYVRKASAALQLGNAREALRIIENAEATTDAADVDSFTTYLSQKADVYSALGEPSAALGYARLAVDIASKRNSAYLLWRCLTYLAYTFHAMGNLPDAERSYMRAENVARESSLTWEPAMMLARRAWIAFLMGRGDQARSLCLRAFETPAEQRWMVANRAWVAMLVGISCGDAGLVTRAADPALVERALSSRDAYTVGPIAAAFAAYHRMQGRERQAEDLVHDALAQLESPDTLWPLFPQIAAHGCETEIERAREILGRFPAEHYVARAHTQLFEAILARRAGDSAAAEHSAAQARLLFETHGCAYYATHCTALSGRITEARHAFTVMGCVRDAAALQPSQRSRGRPRTTYERLRQHDEIVQLLGDGHTNASIASRLGVSLRTVKNRIAEIFEARAVSSRAELLAQRGAGEGPPRSTPRGE